MSEDQIPTQPAEPIKSEPHLDPLAEEPFHPQRSGVGGKLLALVFGAAIGVGAGYFLFKSKVTEAELRQVEAWATEAEQGLVAIKADLESLWTEMAGKVCFAGPTDPGFEKAREMVLASMSGSAAYALAEQETEKTASFLTTNDRLWRVSDEGKTERFDEKTAALAVGKYAGEWNITFPGNEKADMRFDLDLNGFSAQSKPNVLSFRDKDGTFTSTIEFRKRLLGTSPEDKLLHLVLDNPYKNARDDILYYGFRFPVDLKKKQRARGKVLGLTPDREWVELGEYRIERK